MMAVGETDEKGLRGIVEITWFKTTTSRGHIFFSRSLGSNCKPQYCEMQANSADTAGYRRFPCVLCCTGSGQDFPHERFFLTQYRTYRFECDASLRPTCRYTHFR